MDKGEPTEFIYCFIYTFSSCYGNTKEFTFIFNFDFVRSLYLTFSFSFQVTYLRIYIKLRYRFAQGFVSRDEASTNPQQHQSNARRQLRGRRLQRTNMLLISIAVIFCISWLPLNLYNLIADNSTSIDFTTQKMTVIYAVCHMMGMSSACSNPVLYGWLNDNFWKEFKDIMCFSSSRNNPAERFSLKKPSRTQTGKAKPEIVMDFQQGTTVNTEMSVLTS